MEHKMTVEIAKRIAAIAQGNPGSISVMVDLFQHGGEPIIAKVEALGINQKELWVAYKNQCGQDTQFLLQRLNDDPERLLTETREFISTNN